MKITKTFFKKLSMLVSHLKKNWKKYIYPNDQINELGYCLIIPYDQIIEDKETQQLVIEQSHLEVPREENEAKAITIESDGVNNHGIDDIANLHQSCSRKHCKYHRNDMPAKYFGFHINCVGERSIFLNTYLTRLREAFAKHVLKKLSKKKYRRMKRKIRELHSIEKAQKGIHDGNRNPRRVSRNDVIYKLLNEIFNLSFKKKEKINFCLFDLEKAEQLPEGAETILFKFAKDKLIQVLIE